MWAIYAVVYAVMGFLAFKLYQRVSVPEPAPQAKVEPRIVYPQQPRRRRESPPVVVQQSMPEPAIESPPPAPVQPSLPSLPAAIDLPQLDDRSVVPLFDVSDGAVASLLTNTEGLRIDGISVQLGDKTVAGLRSKDGQLEFLWTDGADEDAAAAVRNSILVLTSGDTKRLVRLRTPQKVQASKYDLSRPKFLIRCDVVDPPDPADIRFDFTGLRSLGPDRTEGDDPTCLALRQEALIIYGIEVDMATKVTMRKSGKLAVAELVTQYTLPSGDVEVVTVARGNEKMNELADLIADADDAPRIAAGLRDEANTLREELRSAHVATVPIINRRLSRIGNELATLSDIVATRPSLDADLRELQAIADYSRRLRDTRLPYRFYMDVGGEQVDLIVAE
jgi:hypothetical protein